MIRKWKIWSAIGLVSVGLFAFNSTPGDRTFEIVKNLDIFRYTV